MQLQDKVRVNDGCAVAEWVGYTGVIVHMFGGAGAECATIKCDHDDIEREIYVRNLERIQDERPRQL